MNKPTQAQIDEFVCYCYGRCAKNTGCTLKQVIAAVDNYLKICKLKSVDFVNDTFAADEVNQILLNQNRV
jgi:hypothetical protein